MNKARKVMIKFIHFSRILAVELASFQSKKYCIPDPCVGDTNDLSRMKLKRQSRFVSLTQKNILPQSLYFLPLKMNYSTPYLNYSENHSVQN